MKRFPLLVSILALLVALVAVVWVVTREGPPAEEVPALAPRPESAVRDRPTLETPEGGIYQGVVVDEDGQPVEGASVLLVAFDSGDKVIPGAENLGADPDVFDERLLPVVGFRTAAEGMTDAGGRFRIAADSDSAIRMVAAYKMGYVPELVTAAPLGSETSVTLRPAGTFIGKVVEAESGKPVPGARVTLYLQQRARAPDAKPGEQVGAVGVAEPLSPFAVAQSWVARELGARVWGITWQNEPAMKLWTDPNGVFRFGPIGDQVQLEFVIDHPGYMWTEFDRTEAGHAVRTVVEPGETVERTFELEKGKWISGQIIEKDTGRGVPGVEVLIDHSPQYAQHWWYRTRQRKAVTAKDGTFEVGGLSYGPYTATLRHPSFGEDFVPSIPEFAEGLVWEVDRLGAIAGSVEGLERGVMTRITLVLEAVEANSELGRQKAQSVVANQVGRFLAEGIKPGRYRAWIHAGKRTSMPAEVEIRSLETAELAFELGGGGRLRMKVYEAGGRALDPAEVRLIRVEGDQEIPLGRFVTRAGKLEAEGILPGRYRAEVVAPGYLATRTEPFDIREDGTADVGDVDLRRYGYLRIQRVSDAQGQRPGGRVTIQVREGPEGSFRSLGLLTGTDLPVRPGPVTVRASTTEGLAFERTYDVLDGAVVAVEIVFDR